MSHIVCFSKLLNIDINLALEQELQEVSIEKLIEFRSLDLFQYINRLGNYSSNSWFLSLSKIKLIKFLKELEDIWEYRASITTHYKYQICPPNGNPFRSLNLSNLINLDDIYKIQAIALSIMENLVLSERDESLQNIGAMYVLGALTIVNNEASNALPWLYDSFAI
jgi:hypothetical protein